MNDLPRMKNVAVVAGGYAEEYGVSLNSAQTVLANIDKTRFTPYLLLVEPDGWYVSYNSDKYPVNLNTFSAVIDNEEVRFNVAYNIIHGTPGEDGNIQGYFNMLGIPFTGCDVLCSALTFDKTLCKQILERYSRVKMADSLLLQRRHEKEEQAIIDAIGLPCFVKPNANGSSFGISKVSRQDELAAALDQAFSATHGGGVVVEAFISGRELTCGVYTDGNQPITLPLTEIIAHNDFFDFGAKYEGESEEITPARVDEKIAAHCQELSAFIYDKLHCKGICRIDYILKGNDLYFLELNTTPGFTNESLVPQQIRATGSTLENVLNLQIELALKQH